MRELTFEEIANLSDEEADKYYRERLKGFKDTPLTEVEALETDAEGGYPDDIEEDD